MKRNPMLFALVGPFVGLILALGLSAAAVRADEPAQTLDLQPLTRPKPEIPDEVCQRRLVGWVDMKFVVLADGSHTDVHVTGSEPKEAFDSAAAGAVTKWTYAPQAEQVKMSVRLPMTYADCRSEQRNIVVPKSTEGIPREDCPEINAAARQLAYRFEVEHSGRAVLQGEAAQVYLAPRPRCFDLGKTFRAGTRLRAWAEFEAFSLVSPAGVGEGLAVWVWSHQLKDTAR